MRGRGRRARKGVWDDAETNATATGKRPRFAGYQLPETGPMQLTPHTPRAAMLTPAQVAAAFQVEPSTVYRWARDGVLPAVRIAGTVRIPADALERQVRRSSLRVIEGRA